MVVDDHDLVREGIEALLVRDPSLEVVASVRSGQEALDLLGEAAPDVVLLDLRMPGLDGLSAMREIRRLSPAVRVVVLTGHTGDELIRKALAGGAAGYLLKTDSAAELRAAVRQAASEGRLPPSAAVSLSLAAGAHYSHLSERETEVLALAGRGLSNKQIATSLGLAENTVKNQMKSVIEKLQANDRTEAVTLALRRGILELL
jgi:DNA-binding NarL/FixJ family response regulator